MYKVYDLKNRNKIICKDTAANVAKVLECDISYIYKANALGLLIRGRYKIVKASK